MLFPDEYINADGFVTVEKNANAIPGEGNGWLQTGLAWACGMYDGGPILMLTESIESPTCPLLWRSPHKRNIDDDEKCDDYWGALPMHPDWAASVLEYARKNNWDFSIHAKDKGKLEYRFDRFIHFPPFLRLCAGESLAMGDKLILASSILLDAMQTKRADGNMKAYCRLKVIELRIPQAKPLADIWRKNIRQRYGTIGKSWAEYFGENHPLSQYDEKEE